jgi:hypothetical protein
MPCRSRLVLTVLLLLLWAARPAAAACEGVEAPRATATVKVTKPRDPAIVPALEERLQREAAAMGRRAPPQSVTRGLTLNRVEASAGATLATLQGPAGNCVALREIRAEVADRDVMVLIDGKYRPGSCEYAAILDHEREHVRINADALRRTGELVEQQLGEVLARWGGRWLPAGQQDTMQSDINVSLAAALGEARTAADREHGQIDTLESYAAVQARCNAW